MNSSKKTDPSTTNQELKTHLPLLIRWGIACLMVIVALVAMASKGEGEVSVLAGATFFVVWLVCLLKAGQSAFMVVVALIDRQQDSNPD